MVGLQDIGNALLAFGEGAQGRGLQFQEQQRKQQQTSALAQLGQQLQAGQITPQDFIYRAAQYDPSPLIKYASMKSGVDLPSDVQEYQYYSNLPESEQKKYLNVKRANQLVNQGDRTTVIGPDANPVTSYETNLPPEKQPKNIKDIIKTELETKTREQNRLDAQSKLAGVEDTANSTTNLLRQLVGDEALGYMSPDGTILPEHPGLRRSVGGFDSRTPDISDAALDFAALQEQVRSGAFLNVIPQLQGFGALSNTEGQTATNAYNRMVRAQSEDGFKKAAKEYYNTINTGVNRLRDKAGVAPQENSVPAAAQTPVDAGGGWSIKRVR